MHFLQTVTTPQPGFSWNVSLGSLVIAGTFIVAIGGATYKILQAIAPVVKTWVQMQEAIIKIAKHDVLFEEMKATDEKLATSVEKLTRMQEGMDFRVKSLEDRSFGKRTVRG